MKTVAIATYSSRAEAEFAAQQLAAEGIESIVSSPDAGGQFPSMQVGFGAAVRVAPIDAERATDLLAAPTIDPDKDIEPLPTTKRVQGIVVGVLLAALLLFGVYQAATFHLDSQ